MSMTTTRESSKFSVKQLALTGLMTAVICVLGPWSLHIPVSPVPISLGILGIYFVISVLGMKLGTVSAGAYGGIYHWLYFHGADLRFFCR